MPIARADLAISCRWILPMTSPEEVLGDHTLMVRDGRILDVLPTTLADERYSATVAVRRSTHLLLPGLVDAHTRIMPEAGRAVRDEAQWRIARMLLAGTTCFCDLSALPEESARFAAEQGLRAVIGLPIAEQAGAWADSPADDLTRALRFRDEYGGHPSISTVFAPRAPATLSDATFRRLATLTDELDAGLHIPLHASSAEVDESVARHGARPIERMHALGLLTPALSAVHMTQVNSADIALAERGGIGVVLCPGSNLLSGDGPPPVAAWGATTLRLGVGSGIADSFAAPELWGELRLLALLAGSGRPAPSPQSRAWSALSAATRGAAATLGLDAEIGTLDKGKWADLCCIDLDAPSMLGTVHAPPGEALMRLAFGGGRDLVSDVWVAGRQLLHDRAFTRLDWPGLAARLQVANG